MYKEILMKSKRFITMFRQLNIRRLESTLQKNKINPDIQGNMSKKEKGNDVLELMNDISAKLFALHARLKLGPQFPNATLVKTFLDFKVTNGLGPVPNNRPLFTLGTCITEYFVTEYLMARWPRLPCKIMNAALSGYCGTKALSKIGLEWGLETSNKEVNVVPKSSKNELDNVFFEVLSEARNGKLVFKKRSLHDCSSSMYNKHLEKVVSRMVLSVIGGVYLHCGLVPVKKFVNDHVMSRHLSISSMFSFEQPGRELSVLCSRQKLEPPVSRLIAETGRRSSAPLFVVGVYSGNDKLGEGHGSSLKEAKYRASVDALKAWYLYESKEFNCPSKTLENDKEIYTPVHIDYGEVIV
ncbi:hypothetical protein T552_00328 [Pneumocystis carinii B80]|uniref:Large ribosomal subunit protein mL44 n=1 Tax=Pneumocystis carinii (strain B80) TaxID=1408658 RepID=A0A0W4ZQF8_PNEC8|nr:hypothetical protein T552_00328 [Pneumocystis carinii B80]KTW30612.1 hypothetical protein T552_00328 [Pneumocystis carinii B80]